MEERGPSEIPCPKPGCDGKMSRDDRRDVYTCGTCGSKFVYKNHVGPPSIFTVH